MKIPFRLDVIVPPEFTNNPVTSAPDGTVQIPEYEMWLMEDIMTAVLAGLGVALIAAAAVAVILIARKRKAVAAVPITKSGDE